MALMAVILGGGGAAGYLNANPPRPDPFTGTDAKELETRLLKRIELMESKDEALRARVEAHLIRGEGGFYRIEQLERELREIKQLLNHKH